MRQKVIVTDEWHMIAPCAVVPDRHGLDPGTDSHGGAE
jgi:hypothetical protein